MMPSGHNELSFHDGRMHVAAEEVGSRLVRGNEIVCDLAGAFDYLSLKYGHLRGFAIIDRKVVWHVCILIVEVHCDICAGGHSDGAGIESDVLCHDIDNNAILSGGGCFTGSYLRGTCLQDKNA